MAIELSTETRVRMRASICQFFEEELDREIGDLTADRTLIFVLQEIAPTIYNHAIRDAQKYFQSKVEDLEGTCFEEEYGFWPHRR